VARAHPYRASLRWNGAAAGATLTYAGYSREYVVEVPGKAPLRGSADPFFRGDGALHNPEDLLLAALTGCHMLSYLALCAREGIAVVGYSDESSATLVEEQGSGRVTEVILRPAVRLSPTCDDRQLARALELHDSAREQCFIANSVDFPVEHEPTVERAAA
jgi:organic hydroperoxide reductase OsmC/OhrA